MSVSEIVLWAIGILITILLAFIGVKKVNQKTRQRARTGDASVVIQSGRDTKIK
ncbi:hypothetical protein [Gimibacter soli]|uniref:Uncharacterized protein n=1 Tax=Gimibacter soli TaxID=3024400 RepID=A0AAE9XTV3_9PROT|nr:hypothetical protein [Gimibacter soli]WCL54290.1 hypothetical protein PH603_00765 [Gimibacter soli]